MKTIMLKISDEENYLLKKMFYGPWTNNNKMGLLYEGPGI